MEKAAVGNASVPEHDCPICFSKYDYFIRKPKQLACQHCFCAICLKIIMSDGKGGSWVVTCPLCRHSTPVIGAQISNLPDHPGLMAGLSRRMSALTEPVPEVLLCPQRLLQSQASTFTLIAETNSRPDPQEERFRDRVTAAAIRRFLLTLVFFSILMFGLQYFFRNWALTWILIILTILCALTGLVLLYITCQGDRRWQLTRGCNCPPFFNL
ncbi:E3 ubiquitin-protein ligase RNF186-like [Mustelus asterias]